MEEKEVVWVCVYVYALLYVYARGYNIITLVKLYIRSRYRRNRRGRTMKSDPAPPPCYVFCTLSSYSRIPVSGTVTVG